MFKAYLNGIKLSIINDSIKQQQGTDRPIRLNK